MNSQSCSQCNIGYELAPFQVGSKTVNFCRKIACPYNVTYCSACTQHYTQISMFNKVLCAMDSCETGYVHVNGFCVANITGMQYTCSVNWCEQCSFHNYCSDCMEGYALTAWGTCQKTMCNVPYCEKCSLNNICEKCMSGYSLSG